MMKRDVTYPWERPEVDAQERTRATAAAPTAYLYDQSGRRRVRFGQDGTLEEEHLDRLLGFVPTTRDDVVRRLVLVPLALTGSVWLGMMLERHGILLVLLGITNLLGLLLLLFGVIMLQEPARGVSTRWLWAAVGAGIGICVASLLGLNAAGVFE